MKQMVIWRDIFYPTLGTKLSLFTFIKGLSTCQSLCCVSQTKNSLEPLTMSRAEAEEKEVEDK